MLVTVPVLIIDIVISFRESATSSKVWAFGLQIIQNQSSQKCSYLLGTYYPNHAVIKAGLPFFIFWKSFQSRKSYLQHWLVLFKGQCWPQGDHIAMSQVTSRSAGLSRTSWAPSVTSLSPNIFCISESLRFELSKSDRATAKLEVGGGYSSRFLENLWVNSHATNC